MKTEPMTCPKCGATMNQHAERLIDPRSREEVARLDSELYGVVHQMHSCPACGASASRIGSA